MMKKIISMALLLMAGVMSASAQFVTSQDLEKYAEKKYGDSWVKTAKRLEKQFNIDSNGALTYRRFVQMPGKSKNELYMMLNDWLSTTFCVSSHYSIRLRDTARGKIVAQGYVQDIAKYDGVVNQYHVSISPNCHMRHQGWAGACDLFRSVSGCRPPGRGTPRGQGQSAHPARSTPRAVEDRILLPAIQKGRAQACIQQGFGNDIRPLANGDRPRVQLSQQCIGRGQR